VGLFGSPVARRKLDGTLVGEFVEYQGFGKAGGDRCVEHIREKESSEIGFKCVATLTAIE
jgi:hypothetical protein